MKITLIACGNKMPPWVLEATTEFIKRLKEWATPSLIEIPLLKRTGQNDLVRILDKEAALITEAIPHQSYTIALEKEGRVFTSETLAQRLLALEQINNHLCFLIGGPEGFISTTLQQCKERWSLSSLTLPHPLARIVLLEALYRALSINHNHPYHK